MSRARAEQGSAVGSGSGGTGSGRLRQWWLCADGGTDGSVPWDDGVGACGGAGQAQGTEGFSIGAEEGNVIENEGGGGGGGGGGEAFL